MAVPPSPAPADPVDTAATRRAAPKLEVVRSEHLVVVHWLAVPTLVEVERVSAAYDQAFRAAKRPLIAIGHLHPEVDGNPT
ncbi:MAG TPA: hypothetical protein VMG12_45495, partial [Polyangiaceae bacterium]|nr:hypothetical protein [Polyangiaceae bacterium]